jgi:hypothetical protein
MSTTSQEKRVRDEKSHPGYGFALRLGYLLMFT